MMSKSRWARCHVEGSRVVNGVESGAIVTFDREMLIFQATHCRKRVNESMGLFVLFMAVSAACMGSAAMTFARFWAQVLTSYSGAPSGASAVELPWIDPMKYVEAPIVRAQCDPQIGELRRESRDRHCKATRVFRCRQQPNCERSRRNESLSSCALDSPPAGCVASSFARSSCSCPPRTRS